MKLRVALAVLATFALHETAQAQRVSGIVSHALTGVPVGGALVTAISAQGDSTRPQLSTISGRFTISLRAGESYTILIRSIGFQPQRVQVGPLAAGQDTVLVIRPEPVPLRLPTMEVEEFTSCPASETGTGHVLTFWNEITTALESARATRDLIQRRFLYSVFSHRINGRNGERTVVRADTVWSTTTKPFKAVPLAQLNRDGYVQVEARESIYSAPDETALLDRSFQDRHCFWITTQGRSSDDLIGLRFMPVDEQRVNDIAGTFWLDAATSELQSLEFSYTRILSARALQARSPRADSGQNIRMQDTPELRPGVDSLYARPGGQVRFLRLDDGTIVVNHWRLWAATNWVRTDARGTVLPQPDVINETGGTIIRIGPSGG